MYKNLRQYIDTLKREDEIAEISVPVDPVLEICEVTDRMSKQDGGGKALLFADTGTDFPVVTNIMGSDRRICMALGVNSLDELTARIEDTFRQFASPKDSFSDKFKVLPLLGKVSKWLPRTKIGRGECQQVIMSKPDLSKLPILKCWKFDGGRFVTLPLVHTKDPVTGARNVGMYRMQVFSDDTTGMHWHRHKTGARHYEEYKKLGKRMPVTVCLGGDPACTFAATAPMPDNVDEYLLAGFIRQKPVELVKCLTNDLEVPADCDFVIEGYVDPAEGKVTEGPFGDHTGFYSLEDLYPVFHVTCITHRKDAVYPATIVGIPPMEDAYIAKATEKIFIAPIRFALNPEITDMHMPVEGTAHNIALINIRKSYPGQAHKIASSMWGSGQMMFNKFLVVSSTDKSIRNTDDLRTLIDNIDIPRDIMFSKGPLDILDHTSDVMGFGGKMCIDATDKLPEETAGKQPEKEFHIPGKWNKTEGISGINDSFARGWKSLFISVEKGADHEAAVSGLLTDNGVKGLKFIFVYDANVPLDDIHTLIWLAAANCDAARDVSVSGGKLIFDARIKAGGIKDFARRWPNVVTTDADTIKTVDRKWDSMGIGRLIPSPSLKYIPLLMPEGAEIK